MGEKQPKKGENKKLLLGILIGCVAMAVLFFGAFLATRNNEEIVTFNDYLENGNYKAAYKEYESANSQYYKPMNEYITGIVNDYNNAVITYDDAVSLFNKLEKSGFQTQEIDDALAQLNALNASKASFNTATELFNDGKQSDSKSYYEAVIESDTNYSLAQDKINEIDAVVHSRIDAYTLADELYLNNETDDALAQYQSIVDTGVDTEHAINRIAKIEDVNRAWEAEFADDNYDRCSYKYGAAAKGDLIYLPYSNDNTHSIVKHNLSDATTEIFVLGEMVGTLVISNINIIDDYIYFIAGENVDSGRTYINPYNVYRMKDDGSELECVALGDYRDLIAYKDGFYATSYSQGIVKLDRNLKLVEVIYDILPEQIQLVEDKLYYTIAESTYYEKFNTQYVYDGTSIETVRQESQLQFGFYSGIELYTHKAYEYYEKLFFVNPAEDKFFLLKFDDIKRMYGLVGSNILFSMETRTGRDKYFVYSRTEQKEKEYTYKVADNVTDLNSIYYDNEVIVFSTTEGFLFTDSNFFFLSEVDLTNDAVNTIDISNGITFENDPIYTDEEVVVVEDGYWHYSNSTYHISIESHYINDVDTNIFVAHIRTTDPEGIYIDSPAEDTHLTLLRKNPLNLSRQFNAVLACNGDFFDEPGNSWTGISIRDGIVYKKKLLKDMVAIYPGGDLVCYTAEDNPDLIYEDLLYDDVRDTLSFGPIMLNEGEYGNDIYTNFLAGANPRCSLGMVEPGHYVIILADGRQPESAGITLKRLADLFLDEGCTMAYNLDGGQSAALMFMGEYVNTHQYDYTGKSFRAIGEIVYFGTSELVPDEIP